MRRSGQPAARLARPVVAAAIISIAALSTFASAASRDYSTRAGTGGPAAAFRARLREQLQALQFPQGPGRCSDCRRALLYTGNYYEGFGCAVHQLGLAQLVALATNRTLVVLDRDIWGYVSARTCPERNWNCVFRPLGSCSEAEASLCDGRPSPVPDAGQDLGAISGPARIVSFKPRGASSKHGSVHRQLFAEQGPLRDWIREAGGVFALRAEVQAWLWSLIPALEARVRKRLGGMLGELAGGGYIALHIRASDNLENTERDFGIPRAAYETAAWGRRLLDLAGWLRARGRLRIRGPVPVVVATDNQAVIGDLRRWHESHPVAAREVHLAFDRESAARAERKGDVLHRKNRKDTLPVKQVQGLTEDIAATVELLASAEALLGSQISNVFRLAAEMHCARKLYSTCAEILGAKDGNATSAGSVWTMDVPWYQDP